jgi:hypothetical protein
MPVIASTGEGGTTRIDAIKMLAAGAILLKPYKAEVLLRAIDTAILAAAESASG